MSTCVLDSSAGAPSQARAFVRRVLNDSVVARLLASAELLVSELVTNVVIHTPAAKIVLTVESADSVVRVEVRDPLPSMSAHDAPDPTGRHGGFGLGIVEAVATSWGIDSVPDGKLVWFELAQ